MPRQLPDMGSLLLRLVIFFSLYLLLFFIISIPLLWSSWVSAPWMLRTGKVLQIKWHQIPETVFFFYGINISLLCGPLWFHNEIKKIILTITRHLLRPGSIVLPDLHTDNSLNHPNKKHRKSVNTCSTEGSGTCSGSHRSDWQPCLHPTESIILALCKLSTLSQGHLFLCWLFCLSE